MDEDCVAQPGCQVKRAIEREMRDMPARASFWWAFPCDFPNTVSLDSSEASPFCVFPRDFLLWFPSKATDRINSLTPRVHEVQSGQARAGHSAGDPGARAREDREVGLEPRHSATHLFCFCLGFDGRLGRLGRLGRIGFDLTVRGHLCVGFCGFLYILGQ